ncbi:RNA-binding protein MEX3B-like [Haliotis rubra]|uniref:RNA-binding protein MEX3B-like n=1 Tax=Haliotis rubra TaxID=36100 RepID=UPI001EE56EE9|nr:RNA-binding protein MEX3B-like [Haliotis rubra]
MKRSVTFYCVGDKIKSTWCAVEDAGNFGNSSSLVVTLAAAIYFIRRSLQQCGAIGDGFAETRGDWRPQPDSGYQSGNNQTGRARMTCRRRRHPDDTDGESQYGKRANMSDAQGGRDQDISNECAVCFENEGNIELSPCSHTNVCIDCVNKIITDLDRSCPFCRSYIQAYAVVVGSRAPRST